MKYSSEVWVFFSAVFAFSSSWPHNSWPAPSWEGRLRSFTPLQVFLWPSFCLSTQPPATFNAWSKAQSYSKGRGQVRRRPFHIWKGRWRDRYITNIYSFLMWAYCPGPALCLGPPAASMGCCWGSKRVAEAVETRSSQPGSHQKGKFSRTSCSRWGVEMLKWLWDNKGAPIFSVFELKLCFSSNRLNLQ